MSLRFKSRFHSLQDGSARLFLGLEHAPGNRQWPRSVRRRVPGGPPALEFRQQRTLARTRGSLEQARGALETLAGADCPQGSGAEPLHGPDLAVSPDKEQGGPSIVPCGVVLQAIEIRIAFGGVHELLLTGSAQGSNGLSLGLTVSSGEDP